MKQAINFIDTSDKLFSDALELLKHLIAIPSFSKEENKTADAIETFFEGKRYSYKKVS